MLKAPLVYFPSTVVFLDDDHFYAQLLMDRLRIDDMKHFVSPDFLLRQKNDDFLFVDGDIFENTNFGDLEYLKSNLPAIKKSRTLISVVVSDLCMDNYSGTAILAKLNSPYISRILVSNFIDYRKNSEIETLRHGGQIDIVLDKNNNFVDELPRAIRKAKYKFFTALSNLLYANAGPFHPFSDTEFAKFFISKIDEYKPDEISSNNTFNRFVFSKNKFEKLVLYITDQREIQSYLASRAAQSAPSELLARIASGGYMLCHNDDVLPDGSEWPLICRPAKQFSGHNGEYLYSIAEG